MRTQYNIALCNVAIHDMAQGVLVSPIILMEY